MTRAPGTLRTIIIVIGSTWFTLLLNILKVLVLPAKLDDSQFGTIVFAVSYTVFFGIFVSLGTSPYLVRAIARDPSLASSYISNALVLRVLMAGVIYALLVSLAQLLGYSGTSLQILYIIGLQMVIFTISNVFEAGLQALGQMSWKAVSVAIGQSAATLVGVSLLLTGANEVAYAWSLPLGMIIQLIMVSSYFFRFHPIKFSINPAVMKALLIGGLPLFIWGFLQTSYGQIDATILSLMTGQSNQVVGWFGAAAQITNVLVTIPAAIAAVVLPILSAMHVKSEQAFSRTSIRALVTTLLILTPIGAGLAVSSSDVIRVLPYKPAYMNAAPALSLMALAVPMTGLLMVLATMAVAINQEKQWIKISAFAVCIFPPLYVSLIWWFHNNPTQFNNGATGAALANLIGETLLTVWAWFVLPKQLRHIEVVRKGLQILALTFIMAVVVKILQGFGVWLFAYIAAGGLVYAVGAWALRLITPSDLQQVRNALLRRGRRAQMSAEL